MRLLKKFLQLFKRSFLVVEVQAPRPIPDKEDSESIKTLAHHPGFAALMNVLKIQRSFLETKLKRERHASLDEIVYLQSGIYWSEFFEREVNSRVNKKPIPRGTAPDIDTLAEFNKINSQIERVGLAAQ